MSYTTLKFYLIMAIISIALIVGVIYTDKQIRDYHVVTTYEETYHRLTHIKDEITLNLYSNIQAIKGLPFLFAVNPQLSQDEFNTAIKKLIEDYPQFRNIAAAPDLVIDYMYPMKGNEAAFGLDYRSKPEQLPAVIKAKETRELILAGPLDLVQGGSGLISRIPVYLNDQDGNEFFWGIISAVIDAEAFFEESGLLAEDLAIEIAIRGKDGLGADGDVFYGDPKLFQQEHIDDFIMLPNGTWHIVAQPQGGWATAPDDIWVKRFLLIAGAAIGFILLFVYIKALMNAALANLKFKKFLEDNPVPYLLANQSWETTFTNTAFKQLFGYTLDDAPLAETWWQRAFPDANYRTKIRSKWNEYIEAFKASKESLLPLEVNITCKNGSLKTVLVSLSKSDNSDYPIIFYDITERKQAEIAAKEKIEDLAFFDPLTRLPNRRLLVDRLTHAVAACVQSDLQGALLFLDLDSFKTLNDTLGHDMGDSLLQQAADRLKTCMREGDTVARFGGDEFVILLENLSKETDQAVAQTEEIARKVLALLNQPYQLDNHTYTGSVSIGSTLFDKNKPAVEELLKQADIAMYQAKQDGRNSFRIFDPHMQAVITSRVELEKELIKAIDEKQFCLYYQAQVNAKHKVIGAEALIRWSHPKRGLISPFHFIPLAEETGLIIEIGEWLLHTACKQLKSWEQHKSTQTLTLSINISANQFRQKDFVSVVAQAIAAHNINPTKLRLELTESVLLDKIDETVDKMSLLAKLGIRFSLDDFGTGYSSLQYLKRLPLFQLKIDQSFIRDLADDSSDQEIVRTIIAMAKGLELNVIAEGVETLEQKELLIAEDCRQFQGYLFSQPLPIDAFENLLPDLHIKT